jgi:hypothetical protein
MPARLTAAQRAARGIRSPSTSYFWISDELLQESFNAFMSRTRAPACRRYSNTASTSLEIRRRSIKAPAAQNVSSGPRYKRYGSSVPGPLEARRRLSKRRLGCLATGHYGNPPVDPAILFGLFGGHGRKSQQQPQLDWLAPGHIEQKKVGKHQYPNLPAWLDIKHPQENVRNAESEESTGHSPTADLVTIEQYKARLAGLKTVADIRALNKQLEYAALDERQCSRAAFESLMRAYKLALHARKKDNHPEVTAAAQTLLTFVGDHKLECSHGYNLMKLLTVLRTKEVPWNDFIVLSRLAQEVLSFSRETLDRSLRTQISLDILQIGCRASRERSQEQLLLLCGTIWQSHSDIKIPHAVAAQVFLCVSKMEISSASMGLAIESLRVCKPSAPQMLLGAEERKDTPTKKNVSFHWVEALGSFARCASTWTQPSTGSIASSDEAGILYLLKHLPKETVALFAGIVTHTFVHDLLQSEHQSAPLHRLCAWIEALDKVHKLHWTTGLTGGRLDEMVKAMAGVVWPSDVPFVFDKLHSTSMCNLWKEHWLHRLEKRAEELPEETEALNQDYHAKENHKVKSVAESATTRFEFNYRRCSAQLEKMSSEWYNPQQIMLISLVHAAYLSDLDWQRLLLELLKILKLQNRHRDLDCLVRGWKRLTRVTLFTPSHRNIISSYISSRRAPDAYMEMRLLQQDECLYLSDHPHLISDCIDSDSVRALDVLRLLLRDDPRAILPHQQLDSACILTPERIDLIHDTALSIATSARFSCRESCSSVHFLWRLLRFHCAPIDDRFAEAIIVSNLLKPIAADEWVPTEQLDWAFGVIRDMHSEEAVEDLNEKLGPLRVKKPYQMLPYGLQGEDGASRWEEAGRKDVDWSLLPGLDQHAESFVGPKWMSVKARRFENIKLMREARHVYAEKSGTKDAAEHKTVVRRVDCDGMSPAQHAVQHYWKMEMPERPTAVDWWRIVRENAAKTTKNRVKEWSKA